MGIPLFYRKITSCHPDTIRRVDIQCNTLLLDFNCVVHQAANQIIQDAPTLSESAIDVLVIDRSIEILNELVAMTGPNTVYLALDGLAPVPKIWQQKKRRFASEFFERNYNREASKYGFVRINWNRVAITPGTKFMKKLNSRLDDLELPCDYIFSSSEIAGEGEQKIMKWLRKNRPSGNNFVFGMDADLIVLSLLMIDQIPDTVIYLLRESIHIQDQETPHMDPYLLLDISRLRSYIDCPINDYIIMSMFLGNDFLPPLSYLTLRNNGYESLMNAYQRLNGFQQPSEPVFYRDYILDLKKLREFFKILEESEFTSMRNLDRKYYQFKVNLPDNPLEKIKMVHDMYPVICKFPRCIQYDNSWYIEYYTKLFPTNKLTSLRPETVQSGSLLDLINTGSSKPERIHQICSDYIKTLIWNISYYYNRPLGNLKPSKCKWYYRHSYSPLLRSLATFRYIHKEFHKSYVEIEDMLCFVVPFEYRNTLPVHLRNRITKTNICFMTYQKLYAHECGMLFHA